MRRKRTHEEFIKLMQNTHPNIEVLGTYVNNSTKILCKCKIHEHEWEVRPNNLLSGNGCPICAGTMKKTHDQFLQELHEVNPDIEVLGTYKNGHTKIKCKCKIDGHIWETRPNDLLRGHGCPKCGRTKKLTHEEFMEKFYKQNKHAQDIQLLGRYINNKTIIKCKCRLDGYEWEVTPNTLLRGTGCPKCSIKNRAEQHRKTHEQFLQELYEVNPNIEVLENYQGAKTKIKCKCKVCGYIWEARPNGLLSGRGCHKCGYRIISDKLGRTHEQFIEELQEINPDIEILGTYKTALTKIKCKCKIDGYEWEAKPSTLLNGNGCPKCAGTLKKTHEQFMQELYRINPDIEVLGTYVNALTKILCKCKIDGHIWETKPASLLRGIGCPKCNTSKGEKRVAQYLDSLNIDYIYDKRYFKDLVSVKGGLLRPDFLIPSLKIWIEYDGEQHYEPQDFTGKMSEQEVQEQFEYTQQNDQIKNQYAKQHNWTLIRIPYYDYDNIEQILDAVIKQKEAI